MDKIYTYTINSAEEIPLRLISVYEVIAGDGP
jgi:hypothetical protein